MNLSESCFNDIVFLVEEFINEKNGLTPIEGSVERHFKKELKGLRKDAKNILKEKIAPEDTMQRIESNKALTDLITSNHDKQRQISNKLKELKKKKRESLYGF